MSARSVAIAAGRRGGTTVDRLLERPRAVLGTLVGVQVALALILGGALGNLYDRLAYGYVVDFLEVYWRAYHWPSFNVADSAISIGVLLLAIEIIRNETPHRA